MVDWEFLGIEPTTDIKKLKHAYAKMLKVHHPEDDPEGYQRLRKTFDNAKRYAKTMKAEREILVDHTSGTTLDVDPRDDTDKDTPFDVFADSGGPAGTSTWDVQLNQPTTQLEINSFMEKVANLYNDFPARIQPSNWERLLNKDIVWNMAAHEILTYRITDFLERHHQLPIEIWVLLNRYFNWKEAYPTFFEEHILNHTSLPYQPLVDKDSIDRDAFLLYRDQFFRSLKFNQLSEAKMAMDKAAAIFATELDLLRLQTEYYRRIKDYDSAIHALTVYLQHDPEDLDIHMQKAALYFETNRFDKALYICEQMEKENSDNIQVLCLLGKSLYKLGDMNRARKMFKRVLKKEPFHPVAQAYLAKATANSPIKKRFKFEKKTRDKA